MLTNAKPDVNAQARAVSGVQKAERLPGFHPFAWFSLSADGFQADPVSTIGGDRDDRSVHHPAAEADRARGRCDHSI